MKTSQMESAHRYLQSLIRNPFGASAEKALEKLAQLPVSMRAHFLLEAALQISQEGMEDFSLNQEENRDKFQIDGTGVFYHKESGPQSIERAVVEERDRRALDILKHLDWQQMGLAWFRIPLLLEKLGVQSRSWILRSIARHAHWAPAQIWSKVVQEPLEIWVQAFGEWVGHRWMASTQGSLRALAAALIVAFQESIESAEIDVLRRRFAERLAFLLNRRDATSRRMIVLLEHIHLKNPLREEIFEELRNHYGLHLDERGLLKYLHSHHPNDVMVISQSEPLLKAMAEGKRREIAEALRALEPPLPSVLYRPLLEIIAKMDDDLGIEAAHLLAQLPFGEGMVFLLKALQIPQLKIASLIISLLEMDQLQTAWGLLPQALKVLPSAERTYLIQRSLFAADQVPTWRWKAIVWAAENPLELGIILRHFQWWLGDLERGKKHRRQVIQALALAFLSRMESIEDPEPIQESMVQWILEALVYFDFLEIKLFRLLEQTTSSSLRKTLIFHLWQKIDLIRIKGGAEAVPILIRLLNREEEPLFSLSFQMLRTLLSAFHEEEERTLIKDWKFSTLAEFAWTERRASISERLRGLFKGDELSWQQWGIQILLLRLKRGLHFGEDWSALLWSMTHLAPEVIRGIPCEELLDLLELEEIVALSVTLFQIFDSVIKPCRSAFFQWLDRFSDHQALQKIKGFSRWYEGALRSSQSWIKGASWLNWATQRETLPLLEEELHHFSSAQIEQWLRVQNPPWSFGQWPIRRRSFEEIRAGRHPNELYQIWKSGVGLRDLWLLRAMIESREKALMLKALSWLEIHPMREARLWLAPLLHHSIPRLQRRAQKIWNHWKIPCNYAISFPIKQRQSLFELMDEQRALELIFHKPPWWKKWFLSLELAQAHLKRFDQRILIDGRGLHLQSAEKKISVYWHLPIQWSIFKMPKPSWMIERACDWQVIGMAWIQERALKRFAVEFQSWVPKNWIAPPLSLKTELRNLPFLSTWDIQNFVTGVSRHLREQDKQTLLAILDRSP